MPCRHGGNGTKAAPPSPSSSQASGRRIAVFGLCRSAPTCNPTSHSTPPPPVGASLHPAFALSTLDAEGRWHAHSIQLLSLDREGIADFTAFMRPLAQGL